MLRDVKFDSKQKVRSEAVIPIGEPCARSRRPPHYGPLRIAASGDIMVARHAGINDAAHVTTTTIAVE